MERVLVRTNGNVAIDSEERDICSRWRERSDMMIW